MAANAASLTANLPKCAQDCISTTQPSSQCSGTDVRCLCGTSDYSLRLGCCLSKNCNTNDQQSAIDVTQGICKTVNVNLPDFVSCNADYTSAVDAAIAEASTAATAPPSASTAATAAPTQSQVDSIQPGVVLPSATTIVSYSGRSLFTGTCTSPQFALVTQGNVFLEYPWVGCSNLYPDCCPFDLRQGGLLSVCPADYTTVSKTGCCPSGYIPYTTTFPGINVPCYTTPILPLIPPGATANSAVSVIRTQLFALQYTVVPRSSTSSLATGPIAGITVGAVTFLVALLGSGFFFVRKKRRQRDLEREATKSRPVSDVEQVPAPTLRGFGIHTGDSKKSLGGVVGPAELDSPVVGGPGSPGAQSWAPQSPRVWSELGADERVSTPQEMEGDTFIHAYHPALGGAGEENPDPVGGRDEEGSADNRRVSGNDTFKQAETESPRSAPFDAAAFSGIALGGMGEEEEVESPILRTKGARENQRDAL